MTQDLIWEAQGIYWVRRLRTGQEKKGLGVDLVDNKAKDSLVL